MTNPPTINRWIISHKNFVAKRFPSGPAQGLWWIDIAPGSQATDDTTIVYVKDMGGGNIALQTHGTSGASDAYVSMIEGGFYPPENGLSFRNDSNEWVTQPAGRETFQVTPTGDGGFTLTCPFLKLQVVVAEIVTFGQKWLMAGRIPSSESAHFTAVGLDHPVILDFLQLGRTASGLSFAGVDLSNKNLAGYDLSWCDFRQVKSLDGCIMTGANLQHAKFTGCTLAGAKLGQASLADADFGGADLAGADFTGTDLTGIVCSAPLKHLTDPNHPAILTGCTVPYALIRLDWSCLDLTDATITGMPANSAGKTDLTGLNA